MRPVVSWRYHAASLVAVFVALLMGVGIGGLVLHGSVVSDLHRQVRDARHDAALAQHRASAAATDQTQAQALVDQLGRVLLPNRLRGQKVVVVSTPGVSDALRRPLVLGITSAGGAVVGDLRLSSAAADPASEGVLADVATQLVPAGVSLPSGALPAAMTVLAASTAGAVAGPVAATDAVRVLAALKAAGITQVGTRSDAPGGLVLILAPPGASSPGAASLLTALVGAYSARHAGVVVTSPGPAAASLRSIRADPAAAASVSTLDRADAAGSALRVVLALAADARGIIGHYGGDGQTAAAPPT